MTIHRERFVEQLSTLETRIQEMATLVDARLERALATLTTADKASARGVIDGDAEINALRLELENECITLLAEQAPVAGDLRLIIATLFTATELERVADYAVAVSSICIDRPSTAPLPSLDRVLAMGDGARDMVRDAVAALVARDDQRAFQLAEADDRIDRAQDEILEAILADDHSFEDRTRTLWITHNLERVADRATNIAERAIYLASAEIAELN